MGITTGTRHQKIIGDYGENLICNWLSRSGFEVAIVGHKGIDIVAYNPITKQRIGITVKSRTRKIGKETDSVNVFINRKNDYQKVIGTCKFFACEPWLGIYVEATDNAELYLTSLENYKQNYCSSTPRAIDDWKINSTYLKRYEQDKLVKHIKIDFHSINWEW